MANPEHVGILKQGVEEWNNWRKKHPTATADFSGADFSAVDLRGVNLAGMYPSRTSLNATNLTAADLRGADLSGASLIDGNLTRANLSGADLRRADLIGTNFSETNLAGASLTRAYLEGALLIRADLTGADFSQAMAKGANFADVDLSAAKGLDSMKHYGPSTIGIDAIYKSRGKIPENFLRGCGVPDEFIAYIGSMFGRPIEFFSCFISYSTKDQDFVARLHADLQARGVRCWFAPHDIAGGAKLHEQIDEVIRLHDKLLVVLSEHSMRSEWVKTEISQARRQEEREKKRMLFPITLAPSVDVRQWTLFDADRGIDSAREIREYFIPDFSNWKDHDAYNRAFSRLVKDLSLGRTPVGERIADSSISSGVGEVPDVI